MLEAFRVGPVDTPEGTFTLYAACTPRGALSALAPDTWVAAWRRPPSDDRPVRPWLRRVLHNAARFHWRGEAHRAERERDIAAFAEDATPSTDELLERHETQQLLARLVGELEEPFRATVLLCYAEGLTPAEVARRLGVPSGTIRSRLHEGLERLRARLDSLHRGERRARVLALAPLANRAAPAQAAAAKPLVAWAIIAAIAAACALLLLHAIATPANEPARPRVVRTESPAVVSSPGSTLDETNVETITKKRGVSIAPSAIAVVACTQKHEAVAIVKTLRASSAALRPFG